MNMHPINNLASGRRRGFTLMEILLAVAILGFIVITMLAMFDLVQKSFRAGTQQAGVFEPGKATMEILAANLEQIDLNPDGVTHLLIRTNINMQPWVWYNRPGSETNYFHDHYSLRLYGNKWIATAYRVVPEGQKIGPDNANVFAGTLITQSFTNFYAGQAAIEAEGFLKILIPPDFNKDQYNIVAEGVVNFSLVPLNKDGQEFRTVEDPRSAPETPYTWRFSHFERPLDPSEPWTNALPTYLEFKASFVEPSMMARIKRMPTRQSVEDYLKERPQRVHIFKRRVPILTADRIPNRVQ